MRSDAETFQPLGPAKPKPAPEPKPEWTPVGNGIEVNRDGQKRTNKPENEAANNLPPFPFPYYGSPQSWGRAIEWIRRGK